MVGLEAARQGIDDARYVALLRKASPETAAAILKDIELYSNLIGEYIESHREPPPTYGAGRSCAQSCAARARFRRDVSSGWERLP